MELELNNDIQFVLFLNLPCYYSERQFVYTALHFQFNNVPLSFIFIPVDVLLRQF